MSYNPTEMFNSIKNSLNKQEKTSSKDYLKTEVGNTYTVRIIPNVNDPAKTFFHYYTHSWKSYADGSNVFATSRATWGERDPIAEQRFQISRNGTDSEKEKIKAIRRNENWLAAVYVVNDPVNAENNGKTKILRFGKQIKKVIDTAMDGEESDEFGPRIFDLTANGCNLKIKVEKQGDYPSYTSSRFQSAKEIEGMTDTKINEIINAVPKLESYVTAKSYEELTTVFNEHYMCKGSSKTTINAVVSHNTPPEISSGQNPDINDPEIQKLLESIDK